METTKRKPNPSLSGQVHHATAVEATRAQVNTAGGAGVRVTSEERRRLAGCCAFFKAEKYRHARPGAIRESDIKVAECEIAAAIEQCRERFQSS